MEIDYLSCRAVCAAHCEHEHLLCHFPSASRSHTNDIQQMAHTYNFVKAIKFTIRNYHAYIKTVALCSLSCERVLRIISMNFAFCIIEEFIKQEFSA